MSELLTSAFLTLFVTMDPVGLAPIFISLTQSYSPRARRLAALRAVVIAGLVLAFFALVGSPFLAAVGITLPAFRIAGGLLLFWIAFEMVFERRTARKSDAASRSVAEDQPDDIAAFPLAIPLMAGPGAITAIMLLAQRAEDAARLAAVLAVTFAVLLATFLILLAATPIDRMLGATIRAVVTRLLGVVLAALAVQFVGDGITAFLPAQR